MNDDNADDIEQHKFIFTENDPESLVMLKKPSLIKHLSPKKVYIWFIPAAQQSKRIDLIDRLQMRHQISINTHVLNEAENLGLDLFMKFYWRTRQVTETVWICEYFLAKILYDKLCEKHQYKQREYVEYSGGATKPFQIIAILQDDADDAEKAELFELALQIPCIKITFATDIDVHIQKSIRKQQVFASFRSFYSQDSIDIAKKRSVIAMLRQPPLKNALYVKLFCDLALAFFGECQQEYIKQIDSLMQDPSGKFDDKIFLYYTQQSFLHKMINNLLRASADVTQLFYIQPFVHKMFNMIKRIYHQQQLGWQKVQSGFNMKSFQCYRGGVMTEKEIQFMRQNVGEVVEQTSFLSASYQYLQAANFLKNVYMIITVKDTPRDRELDHGFAFVENLSHIKFEKEVVFNIMNSFKIIKVLKASQLSDDERSKTLDSNLVTYIFLEYGTAAQVMYEQYEEMGQSGMTLKNVPFCLHERDKTKESIKTSVNLFKIAKASIRNQGDAIIFDLRLQYLMRKRQLFESLGANNPYQISYLYTLLEIMAELCKKYYVKSDQQLARQDSTDKNIRRFLSQIPMMKIYDLTRERQTVEASVRQIKMRESDLSLVQVCWQKEKRFEKTELLSSGWSTSSRVQDISWLQKYDEDSSTLSSSFRFLFEQRSVAQLHFFKEQQDKTESTLIEVDEEELLEVSVDPSHDELQQAGAFSLSEHTIFMQHDCWLDIVVYPLQTYKVQQFELPYEIEECKNAGLFIERYTISSVVTPGDTAKLSSAVRESAEVSLLQVKRALVPQSDEKRGHQAFKMDVYKSEIWTFW